MKKAVVFIVFLLFCAVVAVCVELHLYAGTPAGPSHEETVFNVPYGESFHAITLKLEQAGIVKHPAKLRWYARLNRYDKKIKAGEYLLSAAMTPREIMGTMIGGKIALHKITIPEGYNGRQIAAKVSENGFMSEEVFFKAAMNPELARTMGLEADTFEGYLFPDTYHFPTGVSAEEIIAAMIHRFREIFSPEWKNRAGEIGMTVHQVVTLASIIEKETGAAFERPLISSVFHNRLEKRIRLSSDPTVIYGIKNFNGDLTKKDLATPTPYNTYLIFGLPPGPIASPGIASLEAALYPAETDYLYFVSKKDGTHQFSASLREHNRAVRKYQMRK